MLSFGTIISAVVDFLKEAQSLGLIKEFTLLQCDTNREEIPGKDLLLSQFLKKLNEISMPLKTSSSDDEYVFIEDEKRSESDSTSDSPANENPEMLMNADEASIDSYISCSTEQVNEEEKAKISSSHSTKKISPEKSVDNIKIKQDTKETDELETSVKNNLVQINVDTNEMKRRISAFISRKRKEVDEWNVQEFCGRSYVDEQDPAWEQIDSCARVDAIFVPRRGCKSHIKVSRVQNVWGPQTHWQPEAKKIKQEPIDNEIQPSDDATLQAMDERLQILETHLKLKTDSTLRKNLFKRIKMLEDKILYIESTSPEYLHALNPDFSPKKIKNAEEKINLNNVDEIQQRIETLKRSLKIKALHV